MRNASQYYWAGCFLFLSFFIYIFLIVFILILIFSDIITNANYLHVYVTDTENIRLVFCAVKDTIMQNALREFNLA